MDSYNILPQLIQNITAASSANSYFSVSHFIALASKIWFVIMGESFQDYSWIQDFEADFP